MEILSIIFINRRAIVHLTIYICNWASAFTHYRMMKKKFFIFQLSNSTQSGLKPQIWQISWPRSHNDKRPLFTFKKNRIFTPNLSHRNRSFYIIWGLYKAKLPSFPWLEIQLSKCLQWKKLTAPKNKVGASTYSGCRKIFIFKLCQIEIFKIPEAVGFIFLTIIWSQGT